MVCRAGWLVEKWLFISVTDDVFNIAVTAEMNCQSYERLLETHIDVEAKGRTIDEMPYCAICSEFWFEQMSGLWIVCQVINSDST